MKRIRVMAPPLLILGAAILGAISPGAACVQAQEGLASLQHARISPYELKIAGGGDPAKAPPALVAVLGDSRLNHSYAMALAFSPNGKLLASVGGGGAVQLWNPESGEERARFTARPMWNHGSNGLYCLAFSPDGRMIAAGGLNNAVTFWDLVSGREVQVFHAQESVRNLAFSPDGRLLATGLENEAQLWNLGTGKLLYKLAQPTNGSKRQFSTQPVPVTFTSNGQTLFVGYPSGIVHAWDCKTGKLRQTVQAHDMGIESLALSKEGRWLLTGSMDKKARLWEANTGRLLHTLEPSRELYVVAVAFHPDGKTCVTGCLDGSVKYWDIDTGKERMTFTASRHVSLGTLVFSPDGKTLASAGLAVRVWDAATGKARFVPSGHTGLIKSVAFSPDSRTLFTGGADGTVKLWDPVTQKVRQSLDITRHGLQGVAISPDGATLATLDSGKPAVRLWDIATGRPGKTFELEGYFSEGLAFSSDGDWLTAITLYRGCVATIWDLRKGTLHGRVNPGLFGRGSLVFSRDSKKVIMAGQTNFHSAKSYLHIWDLATLRVENATRGSGRTGRCARGCSQSRWPNARPFGHHLWQ
jgi:WD40 repeat protein